MIEKILGLISLGQVLSGVGMARKFVADLIVLVALTIIATIIAGLLLAFGLFECHEILMHHGLDADMSALFTGLIGLLLLLIIVGLIALKLKSMQRMPISFSRAGIAGASLLTVFQAFYRGLADKKPL